MTPTAHMGEVFTHSPTPSVYVLSLSGIRWVLFRGRLICIIISKTFKEEAYVAAS